MSFHQLELGVLVVIEFHLGPFDKIVALLAFFTEAPFMVVVISVAVDAFHLQFFLKIVVLMTGSAFRLIMGASKRELGFIMVEFGLRPTFGVMTFVAFFAKSAGMNIVQRMAINAF